MLLELLVVGVLLFFAWKAAPMISYAERLTPFMVERAQQDMVAWIMYHAFSLAPMIFLFVTAVAVVACFVPDDEPNTGSGAAVCLLLMAPLDWWIGQAYRAAEAQKAACTSWLGCSEDYPVLSMLLFDLLLGGAALGCIGLILGWLGKMGRAKA